MNVAEKRILFFNNGVSSIECLTQIEVSLISDIYGFVMDNSLNLENLNKYQVSSIMCNLMQQVLFSFHFLSNLSSCYHIHRMKFAFHLEL